MDGIEQTTAAENGQIEDIEDHTNRYKTQESSTEDETSGGGVPMDSPVSTSPEPITVQFVPEVEEEQESRDPTPPVPVEQHSSTDMQNGSDELIPRDTTPSPSQREEDTQKDGKPTPEEQVQAESEDKEYSLEAAINPLSPEGEAITSPDDTLLPSPLPSNVPDVSASALPVDSTLLSQTEGSIKDTGFCETPPSVDTATSTVTDKNAREETSDKNSEPKDGKEWMDILGNGQLMKKVLRKGGGTSTRPTPQSRVKVRTRGTLDTTGKAVDKHHELVFTVGDGDVIRAIDLAVTLMEQGEVAQIKTNPRFAYGEAGNPPDVPPDSSITYEVELLDVMEPLNFSSISEGDLIALVDKKRMRGNELFQRKVFDDAITSYQKAVDMLENYQEEHDKQKKSVELRDMQIRCWNNLAAAQLKVELHKPALESCEKVLKEDPENVKALFRAGKVLSLLGELDEAVIKLQKASALNSEEKAIQLELQRAVRKRDQSRAQEREMYQRMVSGSAAASSKKNENPGKKGSSPKQESFWGPWPYLAVAAVVAVVGMGVAYIVTQRNRPHMP